MNKEVKKILRAYFSGNASNEGVRQAKAYLINHREDEALSEFLAEVWAKTSAENQLHLEEGAYWSSIQSQLAFDASTTPCRKTKVPSKLRRILLGFSLAAIITLAMLFLAPQYFTFLTREAARGEMAYTLKQTQAGERLNIRLPDGTYVKLNASSKLYIPNDYNTAAERVVKLEGEAYFEVTRRGDKKPFLVKTQMMTTQVLGTKFSVQAYRDEPTQFVALEEGKVKVSGAKVASKVLAPEEMFTYYRVSGRHEVAPYDPLQVMGWKDQVLAFRNASFEEIKRKLERWYGVTIDADVIVSRVSGFTGQFRDERLKNVLNNISLAMGFDYAINKKKVRLTQNN